MITPLGGDGVDNAVLTSSNTTTGGEDIVFADVSSSTLTVTLATADARSGARIAIVDINSNAGTNAITVDTEGSGTINGASSITISTSGKAVTLVSDGTDWVRESSYAPGSGSSGVAVEDDGALVVDGATAIDMATNLSVTDDGDGTVTVSASGGSSAALSTLVEGTETGTVAAGDQGVLVVDELLDTETLSVKTATLVSGTVQAVPTGVDLKLGTFSSGSFTQQAVILSGDGATVHDNADGNPLASYQNTSGTAQTVGYVIDNQSGGSESVICDAAGEIG